MKAVLSVVLVAAAVAVAVFAPELLPALIPGISTLGVAAITAGLEIGISLLSSAVLGAPGIGGKGLKTNPVQRLYATLDTTTPRKIVFGDTAGAADIRYQTYTGTNQDTYHQVIAVASHYVGAIYEVWIDNEKAATFSGSTLSPQGRYVNYLGGECQPIGLPGLSANIDSTWTSNCSLTDCAWVWLAFTLSGSSPFQGGVSNRLTIRTKGAYLYDPRLDSTVTGGSGTMRASVNSTWYGYAWDSNRCRNPALQLLFYLLGWHSVEATSLLMVGMGIPAARIDLASFITAANICDETVSLKAGGSEPRYRSDGVVSEGDDRKAVVDALCATMNATLRDAGGKIAIQILHDDLATPVLDLGADDILGNEEWTQTPPLSEYYNIVRGRFVDPSDHALYQLSTYPDQSVSSPDGISRILTVDQPMVQSPTQAQRLAKLRLMRAQFQGRYSATFGPRAWSCSIGDIVRLTHPALNWTTKLFRVVEQKITRTGQLTLTLLEEDSSIYSWTPSTDEKSGITAGTPTVVNPVNSPVLTGDDATVLRQSYPKSLRVTATDAGSSATISLDGGSTGAAFVIDYATNPPQDVTVPAGSITGLAYSTLYYLYADVTAVGSATPTYGATTTYGTAINSSTNPKRIYLQRSVTTPAHGGTTSTGSADGGGYGGGTQGGQIP